MTASTFATFIPGLLGDKSDFSLANNQGWQNVQKIAKEEQIDAHLIRYQTEENEETRHPTFGKMGEIVGRQLYEQQIAHNSAGTVVASSVGGSALLQGLVHLAKLGGVMPHIILIGPVIDPAAKILQLTGKATDAALADPDKYFGMPVSKSADGADPGTFHVRGEHLTDPSVYRLQQVAHENPAIATPALDQAAWTAALANYDFPSVTILTSSNDIYCKPEEAEALVAALPPLADDWDKRFHLKPRAPEVKVWEGGHNDSGEERTNDIREATRRAIRTEKSDNSPIPAVVLDLAEAAGQTVAVRPRPQAVPAVKAAQAPQTPVAGK